jgi:hypothetical protein
VIDRDQQPLGFEAEFLRDQVPGQLDRAILEIIAERKVAEHLEERVMARGIADIVEIVVLAAGAHAFLRRHRRSNRAGAPGPVKTFLNCTMPALVNISVGSLRGTSGLEATTSCPFVLK